MTLPQVLNELTEGKGESETATDAEIAAFTRKLKRGLI